MAYDTDFANLPLGMNRFTFPKNKVIVFVNDVEKTKNQRIVEKKTNQSRFLKDQN